MIFVVLGRLKPSCTDFHIGRLESARDVAREECAEQRKAVMFLRTQMKEAVSAQEGPPAGLVEAMKELEQSVWQGVLSEHHIAQALHPF